MEQPDDALEQQLVQLLQSIEAGGQAVLPEASQALLQSIVDAAARIFGAAAASIALVNEREQMLEFKVAYGAGQEGLVGMRVPLDRGIAGYVAMSGQPIAISDVQQDVRFNQDFARSTGYVPKSILATPLLSGERVIGVMEVLDKIDAPSFGLQDMDLLGIFAGQAAIAIHQSQQVEHLNRALVQGLRGLVEPGSALDGALASAQPDGGLLALAEAFRQVGSLGEAEQRACLQVLEAFAGLARSRKHPRFSRRSKEV